MRDASGSSIIAKRSGHGINRLNAPRTLIGYVSQDSDHAPEAFVSALDAFAAKQVSRVNADLPHHPLGRTEVIQWKSTEGLQIEGLLTGPFKGGPGTWDW